MTVDLNTATDHPGIGIESPRPQAVTQDDFVISAGLILLRQDVTAQHGRHAERGKQIGGHAQAIERFRRRGLVAGKIQDSVMIDTQRLETAVQAAHILHVHPGNPIGVRLNGGMAIFQPELHQFAGTRIGKRIDQD